MTPRERWLSLLEGRAADRVPTDYRTTREVTARLMRDLSCNDEAALYRRLHIDALKSVAPTWEPIQHQRGTADASAGSMSQLTDPDMWGVCYRRIDYGGGTYDEAAFHPLAHVTSAAEVHAHPWPNPDDFDYKAVSRALEADEGYYPIQGG